MRGRVGNTQRPQGVIDRFEIIIQALAGDLRIRIVRRHPDRVLIRRSRIVQSAHSLEGETERRVGSIMSRRRFYGLEKIGPGPS